MFKTSFSFTYCLFSMFILAGEVLDDPIQKKEITKV